MSVEKMKIKVNNAALAKQHGVAVDAVIVVDSKQGVPLNREWRNRVKDSKLDGCVTVVTATKSSKKREDK